jgi:hypothetical protein
MWSMFAVTLLGIGMLVAPAQAQTRSPARSGKADVSYTVLKIGDDYKAVPTSDVAAEKKRVADDYKKQMKDYADAKKNKDANAEKPVRLLVKLVKKCKTQQDAQDFIDKLQAGQDKGGGGDKGDKTAKPKTGAAQ